MLLWDLWTVIGWPSINRYCFLSAITILFPFFKGNLFVIAVIVTHFFNSPSGLLYFKELPTLGPSHFIYIVIQNDFDLLSKCVTVPVEPLINLSQTLILSFYIILAPTFSFSFASRVGSLREINIFKYRYGACICFYIFVTTLGLKKNNFRI